MCNTKFVRVRFFRNTVGYIILYMRSLFTVYFRVFLLRVLDNEKKIKFFLGVKSKKWISNFIDAAIFNFLYYSGSNILTSHLTQTNIKHAELD